MMEFNKEKDKILFIDLPPTFIGKKNIHYSKNGINYLRAYLNKHNIKTDVFILKYDYLTELYNKYMMTTISASHKLINNEEHDNNLLEELKKSFLPKLNDYNVLAFSLFSYNSYMVFKRLYNILAKEIDLNKFKLLIGGNYMRFKSDLSEFEKYDAKVCNTFGELFFQELYDLSEPGFFENIQLIDYEEKLKYKILNELICIEMTEGCVNKCCYCVNTIRKEKVHFRDFDKCVEEITYYVSNGVKNFYINTENFGNHYGKSNEFIDKLLTIKKKFNWLVPFSPFNEHKKSYKELDYYKLKKSGCSILIIGVESLSETVRDKMYIPKYTNKDFEEFCEHIKPHNIKLELNFIFCFYNETNEDFEEAFNNLDNFLSKYRELIHNIAIIHYNTVQDEENGFWGPEQIPITYDENGHWYHGDNTYEVRRKRWLKARTLLKKHDFGAGKKTLTQEDNDIIIL